MSDEDTEDIDESVEYEVSEPTTINQLGRIADALQRIANVIDARENRELKRLKEKAVAEDHNATRACRLLITLYETDKTKKMDPPKPGVYALARRHLPDDPETFTIAGQTTFDAGRTWRLDPVRREHR